MSTEMKPIVFFDIEATGVDPAKDRIVQIAAKEFFDGGSANFFRNVNPCMPIPKEASDIHGITDEMAAGYPAFNEFAKELHEFMLGFDLGGFNLLNFDVPLLWEEFFRCGIRWDLAGVNIVDVGNIFKKMEERTLSAAVKFYIGEEPEGAHNADVDAFNTWRVFNAQLMRYKDLKQLGIEELAKFSRFDERADLAGKIVYNAAGVPCYNIGKAKGTPVLDDTGFGMWMLNKDFTQNTKEVLRGILGISPEETQDEMF